MRRYAAWLFLLISSLPSLHQPVVAKDGTVDQFLTGKSGHVSFPTRNVEGFYDLYNGAKDYNARSTGELFLPAVFESHQQTFCAMVILHGSGGEWSGRGKRHAAFLAENGIATFVVDTFSGRGLSKEDRYIERLRLVNMPDQIVDAFAALELLATHPNIDAECIGVMGYSMGGIATFLTAFKDIAAAATRSDRRFTFHVAFYTPCAFQAENMRTTGAPILSLWGENDEATDRQTCETYSGKVESAGSSVIVHWLKGAAHGWNGLSPMTFHSTVPKVEPCQFVVRQDGYLDEGITGRRTKTDTGLIDILRECTGVGYTIGRHEQANDEANRLLLDFIQHKGR